MSDPMGSLALSVLSSCGIVWLFRTWISEQLKHSIGHEYQLKLEIHKNELRADHEKAMLALKEEAERSRQRENAAVQAGADIYKVNQEKRLQAISILWEEMLATSKASGNILMRADILTNDEFFDQFRNNKDILQHKHEVQEEFLFEKVMKASPNSDAHKPFVDERLWAYFYVYRILFLRISYLINQFIEGKLETHWSDDKNIQSLLNFIDINGLLNKSLNLSVGKFSNIQRIIEEQFSSRVREIMIGDDASAASLERSVSMAMKGKY